MRKMKYFSSFSLFIHQVHLQMKQQNNSLRKQKDNFIRADVKLVVSQKQIGQENPQRSTHKLASKTIKTS